MKSQREEGFMYEFRTCNRDISGPESLLLTRCVGFIVHLVVRTHLNDIRKHRVVRYSDSLFTHRDMDSNVPRFSVRRRAARQIQVRTYLRPSRRPARKAQECEFRLPFSWIQSPLYKCSQPCQSLSYELG